MTLLWSGIDEGIGNVAKDGSGNGNNAILANGPTYEDGKFGKALKLSRFQKTYYNVLAKYFQNKKDFTYSMWFYLDDLNPDYFLLFRNDALATLYISSRKLFFGDYLTDQVITSILVYYNPHGIMYQLLIHIMER